MNNLLLTFYGDDFTGSTDGMEALAKAGLRTMLFLEPPHKQQIQRFPGLHAVGVAGNSRTLSPEEMDKELPPIFTALRHLAAPLFHLKICSTFDSSPTVGSIGHTIDVAERTFHSRVIPLVVGAPVLNRFCVFGNLFARSGPESDVFRLDRHPTMSRHPITPMDESDLRLVLEKQTKRKTGLVDMFQIEAGMDAVKTQIETLLQSGQNIVLFDTLTNEHLVEIGRTLWHFADPFKPLLVVGSSGVEYALTAYWTEKGELPPPPEFAATPAEKLVVVSGSCSPIAARQMEWAFSNGFAEVALDPTLLLSAPNASQLLEKAVVAALAGMESRRGVIIHTCCGPDDVRLAAVREQFGKDRGYGKRLSGILGRILRDILQRSRVRRAVIAGGDTSSYVARELGIEALEFVAPMAPGSPLCKVHAPDSPADGMEIVFKGGQVGKKDLYISILKGAV